MSEVEESQAVLKLSTESILSLDVLRPVIADQHYEQIQAFGEGTKLTCDCVITACY